MTIFSKVLSSVIIFTLSSLQTVSFADIVPFISTKQEIKFEQEIYSVTASSTGLQSLKFNLESGLEIGLEIGLELNNELSLTTSFKKELIDLELFQKEILLHKPSQFDLNFTNGLNLQTGDDPFFIDSMIGESSSNNVRYNLGESLNSIATVDIKTTRHKKNKKHQKARLDTKSRDKKESNQKGKEQKRFEQKVIAFGFLFDLVILSLILSSILFLNSKGEVIWKIIPFCLYLFSDAYYEDDE